MYDELEQDTMTLDRPAQPSSHDDPSLDIYLREISRMPVLTERQELDLALRAKGGDQRAIDRLAECNLRFVVPSATCGSWSRWPRSSRAAACRWSI